MQYLQRVNTLERNESRMRQLVSILVLVGIEQASLLVAERVNVEIDITGAPPTQRFRQAHDHGGHPHSFNDMHECIHDDIIGHYEKIGAGWPEPAEQAYDTEPPPYPAPTGGKRARTLQDSQSDFQSIRIHVDVSRLYPTK